MRIVSLLPATTEWVAAFGGLGDLVGRSHACDFPAEVCNLPIVTRPAVDRNGFTLCEQNSGISDERTRRRVAEALSPFEVDLGLLADLEPDLILTQTQCDVCAVSESTLRARISELVVSVPRVVSMDANTLKQVLSQALAIGQSIGRGGAAMRTIAELEKRLKMLRHRLGLARSTNPSGLPSVALLEWLEPPMTAGHWTPDLIALAGGRPVCASPGTRSKRLEWENLLSEDPDVIALTSSGMRLDSVRRDVHFVTGRAGWDDLKAVCEGRVILFDGNAYFNRPGPRLYRSIELLAAAIHGRDAGIDVASHEMALLGS